MVVELAHITTTETEKNLFTFPSFLPSYLRDETPCQFQPGCIPRIETTTAFVRETKFAENSEPLGSLHTINNMSTWLLNSFPDE